jgi:hypothetical protein
MSASKQSATNNIIVCRSFSPFSTCTSCKKKHNFDAAMKYGEMKIKLFAHHFGTLLRDIDITKRIIIEK